MDIIPEYLIPDLERNLEQVYELQDLMQEKHKIEVTTALAGNILGYVSDSDEEGWSLVNEDQKADLSDRIIQAAFRATALSGEKKKKLVTAKSKAELERLLYEEISKKCYKCKRSSQKCICKK